MPARSHAHTVTGVVSPEIPMRNGSRGSLRAMPCVPRAALLPRTLSVTATKGGLYVSLRLGGITAQAWLSGCGLCSGTARRSAGRSGGRSEARTPRSEPREPRGSNSPPARPRRAAAASFPSNTVLAGRRGPKYQIYGGDRRERLWVNQGEAHAPCCLVTAAGAAGRGKRVRPRGDCLRNWAHNSRH